jgi:hypothetical protein
MAKYIVYLTTTASTSVGVEADDADAAVDAAESADMPTLCAQCSGWGQDYSLELSDVWEMSEVTDESGDVVMQRVRMEQVE